MESSCDTSLITKVHTSENNTNTGGTKIYMLARDVLVEIWPHLYAEDLGRLKMAGNRVLLSSLLHATRWRVKRARPFQPKHLILLPRNIVHLEFGRKCKLNFASPYLCNLPPSLTYLDLGLNSKIRDAVMDQLPRTLLTFISKYNQQLTREGIAKLPKSLTHLDLKRIAHFTQLATPDLPRALVYLRLSDGVHISNSACIEALPRGLTSFDHKWAMDITDSCIGVLPRSMVKLNLSWCFCLTDECSKLLPRNLTSLDISGSRLTNKFIVNLPRTLTDLAIDANDSINDEGLEFLPPNLRLLGMSNNEKLTRNCIPHLPLTLEVLRLESNKNFSEEDKCSLPPNIWSAYFAPPALRTSHRIKINSYQDIH